MSILLQVEDLSISFKDATTHQTTKAVREVHFDLSKGETLGIVGETGSGKSLTALSIMGLLPKSAEQCGAIRLGGEDLGGLSPKGMQALRGKRVSMIFQEPMSSLNPVFTCGEQVLEAIMVHQEVSQEAGKAQVLTLFEKVKLPDVARMYSAYPHELSGGQKQRIMIAMAICNRPDLLIADEPTTALDVTVQAAILELLQDLKAEFGMSMIFISHDLGVIKQIADRVLVMQMGQIVETGTIQQIFNQPQHSYTRGLLACRPPLDKRLKKMPEIINDENVDYQSFIYENIISKTAYQARLAELSQNTAILKVENLVVQFPTQKNWLGIPKSYLKAVNNVSFELKAGETLGLVGESGCGKTTLGRAILLLKESSAGQIIYNNEAISNYTKAQLHNFRKDVQIIFQDPYASLNPRKMIGFAIMEPMNVHGLYDNDKQRRQKAIELLKEVGLEAAHFNRFPHEFSGGQRQRICIARALAVEPKVLICDECVSALDVSIQAKVLNLLLRLRAKYKLSYLFISHDLSVVKLMSDRIMVMRAGEIVERADAESLYLHPQEAYTQELIAAIPR